MAWRAWRGMVFSAGTRVDFNLYPKSHVLEPIWEWARIRDRKRWCCKEGPEGLRQEGTAFASFPVVDHANCVLRYAMKPSVSASLIDSRNILESQLRESYELSQLVRILRIVMTRLSKFGMTPVQNSSPSRISASVVFCGTTIRISLQSARRRRKWPKANSSLACPLKTMVTICLESLAITS